MLLPKNLEEYRRSQKYLVAEQPGWSRSLIGLFFAVILGLTIKAQIVPSKVMQMVREATSKADPNLDIQFASARVSLSDGLFPELAVVVQDLMVTPKDDCWGGTNLKVDQIKVPIKFRDAIRGIFLPRMIEVGQAQIDLEVEKIERCEKANRSVQTVPPVNQNAAPSTPVVQEHPFAKAGAHQANQGIDRIDIRSIQVNLIGNHSHELSLRQIQIAIQSHSPRKLNITGFVKFTSSDKIFDLASGGRLSVHYDESINNSINTQEFPVVANLSGTWFEGNYLAQFSVDPRNQNFQLKTEAKYLPLLQILPILKKYDVIKTDLNGRKAWGTFQFQADGNLKTIEQARVQGKEVKLEGDFGEIYVPSIDIQQFRPTIFSPINIVMKNFDFNELLIFMNRQHPSPALGNLGKFYGTLTVHSAKHLSLSGEHSGLEFWFSNKGQRAIQPISLILVQAEWQNSEWDIGINRIQPTGGLFEGKLKLKADNDWKKVEIQADIDELILSSQIQDVMSSGGRIGTLYGNLDLVLESGKASNIHGKINLNEGIIEGIGFKKLGIKFDPRKKNQSVDKFEMLTQVKELDIPADREFIANLGIYQNANQKAIFADLNIVAETEDFKTLRWDLKSVKAGTLIVSSVGKWDEAGKLNGEIKIKSGPRVIKSFILEGHRDEPIFRQKN